MTINHRCFDICLAWEVRFQTQLKFVFPIDSTDRSFEPFRLNYWTLHFNSHRTSHPRPGWCGFDRPLRTAPRRIFESENLAWKSRPQGVQAFVLMNLACSAGRCCCRFHHDGWRGVTTRRSERKQQLSSWVFKWNLLIKPNCDDAVETLANDEPLVGKRENNSIRIGFLHLTNAGLFVWWLMRSWASRFFLR